MGTLVHEIRPTTVPQDHTRDAQPQHLRPASGPRNESASNTSPNGKRASCMDGGDHPSFLDPDLQWQTVSTRGSVLRNIYATDRLYYKCIEISLFIHNSVSVCHFSASECIGNSYDSTSHQSNNTILGKTLPVEVVEAFAAPGHNLWWVTSGNMAEPVSAQTYARG